MCVFSPGNWCLASAPIARYPTCDTRIFMKLCRIAQMHLYVYYDVVYLRWVCDRLADRPSAALMALLIYARAYMLSIIIIIPRQWRSFAVVLRLMALSCEDWGLLIWQLFHYKLLLCARASGLAYMYIYTIHKLAGIGQFDGCKSNFSLMGANIS